MLVSLNLLKKIVNIQNISISEIISKLTMIGIEVESFEHISKANNLIIGQIEKCEKIINTHLFLCQINIGNNEIKQIICGATNVKEKMKVIVALPGAIISNHKIEILTIHGFKSYGMCCSLFELIDNKKNIYNVFLDNKIYEIPSEYHIGDKNVLKLLGLDDIVIDIKLPVNRPDLLSIYNLAKEIAILFNLKINFFNIPILDNKNKHKNDFLIKNKTNKCSNISTCFIKKIKICDSINEIKKYLIVMGIKPINNIVDICNYVMLLIGQPLHVYDFDKLPKKELIIDDNYEGEFLALNNKKYNIIKNDLVVVSDNKIITLGGIIGGDNTKCDLNTKNIIIEIAKYNNVNIRHTAFRLNLINESSKRFIKDINEINHKKIISLIIYLLKKYYYPNLNLEDINIFYDKKNKKNKKNIHINIKTINNILGTEYDLNTILNIFKKTYFSLKNIKNNSFDVQIPENRSDINNSNDLAEEIIHIVGFNDIKSKLPLLPITINKLNEKQLKKNKIKNYLRNYLYEVITYVLINKKNIKSFSYLNNDEPLKIINAMSEDHSYIKKGLISSLLNVISYNLSHQNNDFGIFEISKINTIKFQQKEYLGIALVGNQKIRHELCKIPYSFYFLKGFFENIIKILGLNKNIFLLKEWNLGGNEMHPGKSACIYYNDKIICYMGELHPNIYREYNIKNNKVFVMEIDLDQLLSISTDNFKFVPISHFPNVKRDLSLLMDKDISVKNVINIIKNNKFIKKVDVFDIYNDKNIIANNKKSISFTITLSNEKATLKDIEINEVMNNIEKELIKNNIYIRK